MRPPIHLPNPCARFLSLTVLFLLSIHATTGRTQQTAYRPDRRRLACPPIPLFKDPYVDVDEWRDKPVRHRYVHGGFSGTNARFSFYFPPKEQYQGRFFQYVTPVPTSENLAQQASEDKLGMIISTGIPFAVSSGAYLVETNEGSLSALAGDQKIPGYRVNAAAAEYSRVLAVKMYGPHHVYGYAFGGSGGAYKTISGFENTDTWDGAVPYVVGSPMAIPNMFTARLLALRILNDKFPSILDAIEPGGSGDMYRDLNPEQREVLREVTRLGFPPLGWFNYKTIGPGSFPVLFPLVRAMDPSYFQRLLESSGLPRCKSAGQPRSRADQAQLHCEEDRFCRRPGNQNAVGRRRYCMAAVEGEHPGRLRAGKRAQRQS